MQLTAIILLTACLQVSARVFAQKVTIKEANAPLKEIFTEIGRQTGYSFIYAEEDIRKSNPVTLDLKNTDMIDVLNQCFANQPLSFRIKDKIIVVTPYLLKKLILPQLSVEKDVEGVVTDSLTGETLAGVSIKVKGSTSGTITDALGHFQLTVPDDAVLEVSYLGYVSKEVSINGESSIHIMLVATTTGLNQLVVVGYGTQTKAKVTGSITSIDAAELKDIPMPNITQSIMGRSPGVFIKNTNGQPGDNDNVEFNIRGFGTPLIIIDGMPATVEVFNQLNPNDIAEFNVLKDAAAAAVYGARAGNGVILVTTKRGKIGAAQITYNGNFSLQYFATFPDFVDAEQYARMENLARYNSGEEPIWTEEEILKFHDQTDPFYPNVNYADLVLRKYAPQTQHSLAVRGGTEKVSYFVSGGYFYQEDLTEANDTRNRRYNLRSNIDMAATDKLDLSLDIHVLSHQFMGPLHQLERQGGGTITGRGIDGIMTALFRSSPTDLAFWPGTTKYAATTNTPHAKTMIEGNGYRKSDALTGDVKFSAAYELPFDFEVKANLQFYRQYERYKQFQDNGQPIWNYNRATDEYTIAYYTEGEMRLDEFFWMDNEFNQQYFLTWDKQLNDHNLSAMVVYEILSDDHNNIEAARRRYEIDIQYLFAGPLLDLTNNGSASHGGRKSWISRVNYDYKGKYLFQFSGRYDASPRFPKETRWGFFPSVSVGWRISQEKFMQESVPFISNLKLRASHGLLGYDNTGSFQYLSTFDIGSRYIFDGANNTLSTGIVPGALPNPFITWEKMRTTNVGLDFGLWNNKLEGSFDYFYRLRSDVLGQRNQSIPNTVGADLPQVNYAKFDNRGWELVLNHRNKIGPVDFSIGGNLAWNREKTVLIDQNAFASAEARRVQNENGEWTDRQWGLMSDGLFKSKEEIKNWPDQDGRNNATVMPGDIKLIDYNEDGRISSEDMVLIGRGDFPRFTYGIHLNVSWKGFDFTTLWQGAGLYDFNLDMSPDLSIPFYANNTPLKAWAANAYVPEMSGKENQWLPANTDARWPRYRTGPDNQIHINHSFSDFWLINGGYIRLKNVSLGYAIPDVITARLGINSCRVYVSGYNLLTFFPLDFIDPEADTHTKRTFGSYYPPLGTYNIGINIGF